MAHRKSGTAEHAKIAEVSFLSSLNLLCALRVLCGKTLYESESPKALAPRRAQRSQRCLSVFLGLSARSVFSAVNNHTRLHWENGEIAEMSLIFFFELLCFLGVLCGEES
jgi:hypothetical protein